MSFLSIPNPEGKPHTELVQGLIARVLLVCTKRLLRLLAVVAVFLLFAIALLPSSTTREERERVLPYPEFFDGVGFYPFNTSSDFRPVSVSPTAANISTEQLCAAFPRYMLEFVQPVLKVGHGDDPEKLAAQLESVSACFAPGELLVMSDMDDKVGIHTAVDVLANLPARYYDTRYNPAIKNYLRQKELKEKGQLGVDRKATGEIDGWAMDKYKFFPQIERAWRVKPDKPFYFFYETDTYVFWDGVFRFLQTFDPDVPIYMGYPSPGRIDASRNVKTWFANGGPGFVLSRGAVKKLLERKVSSSGQFAEPSVTQKWLPVLTHDCCGDSVLGWALWHAGIHFQGYWPLFNNHPLHGIPFDSPYWCEPVLTLHKTRPDDMRGLWRWEFTHRKNSRPLLYSDLLDYHLPGTADLVKADWDNGDWNGWVVDDGERGSRIDSFDACRTACLDDRGCAQFTWRGRDEGKCFLMRTFRYGEARAAETLTDQFGDRGGGEERWVDYKSGWLGSRLKEWKTSKKCDVVQWVSPSLSRIP